MWLYEHLSLARAHVTQKPFVLPLAIVLLKPANRLRFWSSGSNGGLGVAELGGSRALAALERRKRELQWLGAGCRNDLNGGS